MLNQVHESTVTPLKGPINCNWRWSCLISVPAHSLLLPLFNRTALIWSVLEQVFRFLIIFHKLKIRIFDTWYCTRKPVFMMKMIFKQNEKAWKTKKSENIKPAAPRSVIGICKSWLFSSNRTSGKFCQLFHPVKRHMA